MRATSDYVRKVVLELSVANPQADRSPCKRGLPTRPRETDSVLLTTVRPVRSTRLGTRNTFHFTIDFVVCGLRNRKKKMSALAAAAQSPLHIDVRDLTFGYVGREPVLRNLNMELTDGARCLLIGANGAGEFYATVVYLRSWFWS
jgi:ABC-type multidrug transport system fused ATPase/permease subunit